MDTETILVVDDTQENRDFVVEYVLKPSGYQSLTAANGKEGLELAIKHKPDLIILDYNMPVLDGPGMLQAMNARGLDIPVILMTFHGSEDIAIEVFRLGARDYVVKPFYPEEMEKAIGRHLAEGRLRREKEELNQRIMQANLDLKARLQELNMLYKVGKHVTALMDIQQLLLQVMSAALQISRADQGTIHIVSNNHSQCRVIQKQNSDPTSVNQPTEDKLVNQVVESGKSLLIDAPHKAQYNAEHIAVYTPLIIGQKVIGVLVVERTAADASGFSSREVALLSALSDYIAIAITNARNYEARQQLKTQLANTPSPAPESAPEPTPEPERTPVKPGRHEISVLQIGLRLKPSAHKLSPHVTMQMMSYYTRRIAGVVDKWQGHLSVQGESMTVYFNALIPQRDHIHRVAAAALMILNVTKTRAGTPEPPLTIHVGVAIGPATLGHIEADEEKQMHVVGEVIALAQRLEEFAPPGQILVEETVIKRLGTVAQANVMGEVSVKRRKHKITAYALTGLKRRNT